MKRLFYAVCALLPTVVAAQNQSVFVAGGGGYTLHSGAHHSDYSSTLISSGSYKGDKKLTYASFLKAGYRMGNLGLGIGLETGNFQHDATITPITSITLDGTVYTTGRYWTPHAFVQYRIPVWKRIFAEPGVAAGVFLTKSTQGEGIGVFDVPSQYSTLLSLAGINAPQLGGLATAGSNGSSGSLKAMVGAQIAVGCRIASRWAVWGEAVYRYSKVDYQLDLGGIVTQNVSFPIHYTAFRLGGSFDIFIQKKSNAQ
ncbi:MAG: hypothetical protein QM743_13970 [Chitinophagaceae bacterium]